MIILLPLEIIPIFTLAFFANSIFKQQLIYETTKNVAYDSTLIITRVESMFDSAESCANLMSVSISNTVQINGLENVSPSDAIGYLRLRNHLQSTLALIMQNYPDISSITIIDKYNNIFSTNNRFAEMSADMLIEDGWKERLLDSSNENIWLPIDGEPYPVGVDTPIAVLGKKLSLSADMEYFGILLIDISEKTVDSTYNEIHSSSNRHFQIINNSGRIISSSEKSEITKMQTDKRISGAAGDTTITMDINGRDSLVSILPFSSNGWKLVSIIPLRDIMSGVDFLTLLVVLIAAAGVLFTVLGSRVLAGFITAPITRLVKTMDKVRSGDMSVEYYVDRNDEVGKLADNFNAMIVKIRELIAKISNDQKIKHEMELALLHLQIKPHFLYNTLDLIYVLSDMGRSEEARDATKALAVFYQVALSKGSEIILIGDEIKNIKAYLTIQGIRYSDVFDYSIDINERILRNRIPKLTIQPIIENAIYHGFKENNATGHLKIKGDLENGIITISISDNGAGMSQDTLTALRTSLSAEPAVPDSKSFGLQSADRRIKLYFGKNYGIEIDSFDGVGTTITVLIPAQD